MTKTFITAQDLLADSFELGARVLDGGFRPSCIIGVWRGGTPVGIAVQELLEIMGVPTEHFAIRAASYGASTRSGGGPDEVRVYGLRHLAELMGSEDRCLIVDDVFDSGRSIDAIITAMGEMMGADTPHDIRTATVHYKPRRNRTTRQPDYWVHETDDWLVYPHEMQGLSPVEIAESKPLPERILRALKERDAKP